MGGRTCVCIVIGRREAEEERKRKEEGVEAQGGVRVRRV